MLSQCWNQSNGRSYEWESIPSNYCRPRSSICIMLYISTHCHARSVDLALLSQHNLVVWTTTMILFLSACLTHCVAHLWKLAGSLRHRLAMICSQLLEILSLSIVSNKPLHNIHCIHLHLIWYIVDQHQQPQFKENRKLERAGLTQCGRGGKLWVIIDPLCVPSLLYWRQLICLLCRWW